MSGPTRVLVVDDSAFVRKVLREILERAGFEIVGVARDGLEALEKIHHLRPDVVTLDLMMPHLDGLAVLEQLSRREERPAVVVVSISGADTAAGLRALEAGAVSLVEKPTSLATGRLYDMERALVAEARAAALARPPKPLAIEPPVALPREASRGTELVVIGTSTGGPHALTQLVPALPPELPVAVAVVVHIPPGYTEMLAKRLDGASRVRVAEASDGQLLERSTVTIARAGAHLAIARGAQGPLAQVGMEPRSAPHRPSVDVLFESASEAYGSAVIGVVLTGMGSDGLSGARAIRAHGGRVLVESESSCVVYGMPRVVHEAGLATDEAPLSGMAQLLLSSL